MRAGEARDIARAWVTDDGSQLPGFRGALWHGSIISMPDDAPLAPSSDTDIVVIVDDPAAQPTLGKIVRHGVLLDVSFVSWADLRDQEALLADHSLAPTFRNPELLADPSGDVAGVQATVSAAFARREWVMRRCESARDRIVRNLDSLDLDRSFHANAMAWLFATGITTHVVLVAGLRNPTVRKRYLAARELLGEMGRLDAYGELLDLLGCRALPAERVSHHLDTLEDAFDDAGPAIRTPVFFANDLDPAARPIAIDGSRDLIAAGDHREAIFWITATWLRCMTVFHNDAPALEQRFEHDERAMLADLGIRDFADLEHRGAELRACLPRLMTLAGEIMDATPEIAD